MHVIRDFSPSEPRLSLLYDLWRALAMEENERLRVGVSERHTAGRRHSLVGLLGLPCRGDRQELQVVLDGP